MNFSMYRLGAAAIASFFLFAHSGDFAQAKKYVESAQAQAPPPPIPATTLSKSSTPTHRERHNAGHVLSHRFFVPFE